MANYLQSDAYSLPLQEVKLARMTITEANATVADTDGILAVAHTTGPCKVELVAASDAADKLTIAFPCTQADDAAQAGLYIKLEAAADDVLAVSASDTTGEINIKLAKTTAANNTAALIQAAIRGVTPGGGAAGVVKGISVAAITCTAAGNWDTAAKAPAAGMANVPFAGGAGETKTVFLAQPSCARSITATTANGDAAGDIGAVSVIVYGTNIDDQPISETLPAFSANTAATKEGAKAFKTVTSVFLPSHDGTGCTISVGWGEKLGLPYKFSKTPLYWVTRDGVIETTLPTLSVDADEIEKNTFDLNGALNSKEICFYMGVPEA